MQRRTFLKTSPAAGVVALVTPAGILQAGAQATPPDSLAEGFLNPPATARAHTWWHWMNGNITREGITKALEWMKDVSLTNLWVNRLIGDAQPNVVNKTTVTTLPFYQADSPLLPSGLLSDVRVLLKNNHFPKPFYHSRSMQVIFGLLYHTVGGVFSGSFYMPYNRVRGWAWESYWIVGGLFSWLIVPPLAALLTIPDFGSIIDATPFATQSVTFVMGLIWGIGGLTYGLGVRYLGMSLGNSVVLGFCSAFGALVPSLYYNVNPVPGKTSFSAMLGTPGGQLVLLGVLVCLIGIAISGRAGMLKEAELSDAQKRASVKEFSLVKGLTIAIISGILSAFFNFGIEAGKPMAEAAVQQGSNPLFQNNVTYVVLLWGGLTTNLLWCLYLNARNHTFGDYTNGKTPITANVLFAGLAGTMWFLQFFFYGMGESKLGNGASSWITHMATIILTANLWGLYLREWSGVSPRTLRTFVAGILVIMVSIVLVGIGNSL